MSTILEAPPQTPVCGATTKRGTPCQTRPGPSGACTRHDPDRPSKSTGTAQKVAAYLDALSRGVPRGLAARRAAWSTTNIWEYRERHPEFAGLEVAAEQLATDEVENALWLAATVDRSLTAIQVWLYNRRPDRWRDMRSLAVTVTDSQLDSEIARLERELAVNDPQPERAKVDA